MQIKKASMASLKARKPWRLAAARNRKGSCITLQLVILLPNQVGPCTSAQEVWHGRRDKRRNHAALTKTGHKSHDGVVNKDHFREYKDAGVDIYIVGNRGLFSLDDDLEKAVNITLEQIAKA